MKLIKKKILKHMINKRLCVTFLLVGLFVKHSRSTENSDFFIHNNTYIINNLRKKK
jgi:hypothetical protein